MIKRLFSMFLILCSVTLFSGCPSETSTPSENRVAGVPTAGQPTPLPPTSVQAGKIETYVDPQSGNLAPGTYALFDTNHGKMLARLFPEAAPKTVENFVSLAEGTRSWTDPSTREEIRKPFYDNLTFHRVIPGFMIQGGCPRGMGTGGPGYSFEDEINAVALGLADRKVREDQYISGELDQQAQINPQIRELREQFRNMTIKEYLEKKGYRYNPTLPSYHPVAGALAMANSGPNTNGSQFFINEVDTPHLTGRHTVFGILVSGQDVRTRIANAPTGPQNRPLNPVVMNRVRILRVSENEKVTLGDVMSGRHSE